MGIGIWEFGFSGVYPAVASSECMGRTRVGLEDLKRFRAALESLDFPHHDDVIGIVNSDPDAVFRSDGFCVLARSMLKTYQRRLQMAETTYRQTPHAIQMLGSLRHFIANLNTAAQDDEVTVWYVDVGEASSYHLFMAHQESKVLGCIFGADRRMVSAEKWVGLWGMVAA